MKHINNPEYTSNLPVDKQEKIQQIKSVIESNHFVSDRVDELSRRGIETSTAPMGSGGRGQIKEMSSGKMRVQIGYGTGKHNYACVALI